MARRKRKKVLLFYNPYSGSGIFRTHLDMVVAKYQKGGLTTIPVRSASYLNISKVLSEIDPDEFDHLAVAGGDGTINLFVNGILDNNLELPVAIYPTGTANDFAHHLNLPDDVGKMAETAMQDHSMLVDVGKCNDRYFINVAALGALVDVSRKTDPNLKNTLGVVSYYLRALPELGNLKPVPVRLTTKEKTMEEEMLFMVAMNGRAAGGFKKISPDAEINDGLLDVILFKAMPTLELIPLFFNVVHGRHPGSRNVIFFQTDRMRIESSENIIADIDGEKGSSLPVDLSIVHDRLRIKTLPEDKVQPDTDEGHGWQKQAEKLLHRRQMMLRR